MSRSGQSSRSTSSYSSGKIALSCQSGGSKQHATYDSYLEPRYTTTTTSSGYSSTSSSSKSSRSSSKSDNKIPLSISHGGSSSQRDEGRSKTADSRYYPSSLQDSSKPKKKSLSCQTKDRDPRYYLDSAYYR